MLYFEYIGWTNWCHPNFKVLSSYIHRFNHILNKEIKTRTDQLSKLDEDINQVSIDLSSESRLRKKLAQSNSDSSGMPQILDYVRQKAEMYELEENMKNWERKVEIAEMASKKAKQKMRASRK